MPSAARPREDPSTTLLLGLAAFAAALLAIFGEKGSLSPLTIGCALGGLVPWALVVGGVRLPPWLFIAMSVPFGVITVVSGNSGGMFPLMLVVVWLTRTETSLWWAGLAAAAALAAIFQCTLDKGYDDSGIIYFAGGLGISWLSGGLLRRSERLAAEVAAMRDAEVERLAAEERARIARDVHDVVAHSLTVVMLNLTGARRALAVDPDRADEALARAELVGRDSLDSIRQVMGLLREADGTAELPHPTIERLPQLVDGFRQTGMPVDLTIDGAGGVDATVELVAYRIVQESLANVLQHAPGASATVVVQGVGDRLEVVVANGPATERPRPSERTGLGTRGMAERVRAVGGQLSSAAAPDGGWRVAAELPSHPTAVPTAVAGG